MSVRRRARAMALLCLLLLPVSCAECVPDIEFVGDGGAAQGGGGPGGGGSSPGTTSSTSNGSTSATTSSSTTGSTSGGCGDVDGCDVALSDASDDFADGADGWCRLVPPQESDPVASITCQDGGVRLRASSSTWNVMGYTPFLYRRIAASEGDFVVSAKLTVSDGAGGVPTIHAHGGGVLIRRPTSTPGVSEAVILATRARHQPSMGMSAVGYEQNEAGRMVEKAVESGGSMALAICKEGTIFRFFQHDGGRWQPMAGNATEGLLTSEPELEVGLAVHAYSTAQLVQADVEWIEIKAVNGSCEATLPDPLPQ